MTFIAIPTLRPANVTRSGGFRKSESGFPLPICKKRPGPEPERGVCRVKWRLFLQLTLEDLDLLGQRHVVAHQAFDLA
ncbi:MAG TPA: hypothetical protein VHV58_08525, partial [Pseudolabrys sp.]|nr:hypothetical protein [Pseudolabrys sp.]